MKKLMVIINVSKGSAYARFNGLTFPVKQWMSKTVSVMLDGHETDFGLSEVIIVDFQQRYQQTYDNQNFNGGSVIEYNSLRYYAQIKKIKWEPTYNCPA